MEGTCAQDIGNDGWNEHAYVYVCLCARMQVNSGGGAGRKLTKLDEGHIWMAEGWKFGPAGYRELEKKYCEMGNQ